MAAIWSQRDNWLSVLSNMTPRSRADCTTLTVEDGTGMSSISTCCYRCPAPSHINSVSRRCAWHLLVCRVPGYVQFVRRCQSYSGGGGDVQSETSQVRAAEVQTGTVHAAKTSTVSTAVDSSRGRIGRRSTVIHRHLYHHHPTVCRCSRRRRPRRLARDTE